MAQWLIYIKERFPLPTYLLLAGGMASSGALVHSQIFSWPEFCVSTLAILMFFGALRLMDEYKDYEKDLIAHPERPLPRGVLKPAQVYRAILTLVFSMLVLGVAVTYWSVSAGFFFIAVTLYLWLMFREFYSGGWLAERPFLYAVTHQFVLLLLCTFAVVIVYPYSGRDTRTWAFGISILGAFFSYEICRKLDPEALPILGTYLSHYGRTKTTIMVLGTSLVAAVGSCLMGLEKLLWPPEALLVLGLSLLWLAPKKYKLIEGVAVLSLLLHLWAVSIQVWTGWPS